MAAALLLASLAGALLLPVSAPQAANGDQTANASDDPVAKGSTNFGSATPTEKFVQSFQQQVSQQLQSALEQANTAQQARLRGYEQQQRELSEHVQAIEQSVAQGRLPGTPDTSTPGNPRPALSEGIDVEPPRVNVRHPSVRGSAEDANADAALVPGGRLEAPSEANAGIGLPVYSGRATPETPGDAHPRWVQTASAYLRGRPGDANVAPHGFIEGRLLNGVVAVQGGPDRDSIVALSGSYQSANGFTADLDGCLALVQGKPEIASGRIDFKLSRLTCNFPDGASRTWDASGWLVDADGIRGVRATIVDNTSRKAAVAAAGGAIGGLGQRLSQQQYQVNSGPAGFGTSTTFTGSPASDAIGGAASGAANALGQSINDYYNLYTPSLQVGGGARVTVVLANDLRLPPSGRDVSQTHVAAP